MSILVTFPLDDAKLQCCIYWTSLLTYSYPNRRLRSTTLKRAVILFTQIPWSSGIVSFLQVSSLLRSVLIVITSKQSTCGDRYVRRRYDVDDDDTMDGCMCVWREGRCHWRFYGADLVSGGGALFWTEAIDDVSVKVYTKSSARDDPPMSDAPVGVCCGMCWGRFPSLLPLLPLGPHTMVFLSFSISLPFNNKPVHTTIGILRYKIEALYTHHHLLLRMRQPHHINIAGYLQLSSYTELFRCLDTLIITTSSW